VLPSRSVPSTAAPPDNAAVSAATSPALQAACAGMAREARATWKRGAARGRMRSPRPVEPARVGAASAVLAERPLARPNLGCDKPQRERRQADVATKLGQRQRGVGPSCAQALAHAKQGRVTRVTHARLKRTAAAREARAARVARTWQTLAANDRPAAWSQRCGATAPDAKPSTTLPHAEGARVRTDC